MLRALLFGVFIAGAGCPMHPGPAPVNPVDPVTDAGADSGCAVPRATQDALTTRIVNACASGGSLDAVVGGDVATARCAMTDVLLDVREAPKLESCVRSWMVGHGGTP